MLYRFLTLLIGGIALMAALPQAPVRIFMIGDSTMANKKPDRYPEIGWGQVFHQYFTNGVVIINKSINGASTKSYLNKGQWQKVKDNLQKGDYLFIEFGHNDEKLERAEKGTTPEEFKNNLIRFINEAKSKEAIPVLLTPVERRVFKGDSLADTHGKYPAITREVAAMYNILLIDMQKKSHAYLMETGVKPSAKLFLHIDSGLSANYPKGIHDNTHFSEQGATAMAGLAADAIRRSNSPLAKHLKP